MELSQFKRYPKSKMKRYLPYFDITKQEEGNGFAYHVNIEKVDAARRTKGYFLLFTTQMGATPEELLYYYRAKDADEKIFAQIKVEMEMEMEGGRIRTHSEKTTDGKTFVTFIACIIRSYMFNQLRGYLKRNSISMKKVFAHLSNIMLLSGTDNMHFAKALTKRQKEILFLFDAEKDMLSSIKG